jgi:anthranilate/para-aminobenzoate synthase component II
METVIAKLITDIDQNKSCGDYSKGQTSQVDKSKELLFPEISESIFYITKYHSIILLLKYYNDAIIVYS